MFEIELRADDREILERIRDTLKCGNIYQLNYKRYGWYPHAKYKVSKIADLSDRIVPFFDRYPLQAKKAEVFKLFRDVVKIVHRKEHLTDKGFSRLIELRNEMRSMNKKHVKPPGYGKTVRPVA